MFRYKRTNKRANQTRAVTDTYDAQNSVECEICLFYKLLARTDKFRHFKRIFSCVEKNLLAAFVFSTLVVLYPVSIDVVPILTVELGLIVLGHLDRHEWLQCFDALANNDRL